jgi:hypothetical protein
LFDTTPSKAQQSFDQVMETIAEISHIPIRTIVVALGSSWLRPKDIYWMDLPHHHIEPQQELSVKRKHALSSRLLRTIIQEESCIEDTSNHGISPCDKMFLAVGIQGDAFLANKAFFEQHRVAKELILRRDGFDWNDLITRRGLQHAGYMRIVSNEDPKDGSSSSSQLSELVWLSFRSAVKGSRS